QMRNMLNILMTSRGVPMILQGDEFANTQNGNNNAYCQDNEISWLDWKRLNDNKDLFTYVKRLIALRKRHPVLSSPDYHFGNNGTGYPEISLHGVKPWELNESEPNLTFAYMFAEDHEKYKTEKDLFIYVAVNAHWEEHGFDLPVIPEGFRWRLAFDSAGFSSEPGTEREDIPQDHVTLCPRNSLILVAS
ncbi:MAG: glycogen debranching enzyme, partial [Lachnospiraceae bacterium]|nr:glycogen debranching enzyme [Lachnospiraceae bacterium]